jgi:IS30 family transposase
VTWQSAIGTLVERQTRLVRLLHLPQRDSDALHQALRARMGDLPALPFRDSSAGYSASARFDCGARLKWF